MDEILEPLKHLPMMARFALVMMAILVIPPLSRQWRIPAVIGFLLFGVATGPSGLQIASPDSSTGHDLSEIGKLLLMFFVGLEIDLRQFNRVRSRSLGFGAASFVIPLLAGMATGLAFGYGPVGALLIGSLLASHTLLAFPVIQQLGVIRNEAVTVTVGATIFTDIAALLVLAICVPVHAAGFSLQRLATELALLLIFVPLLLFGLNRVGHYLMQRVHTDQGQTCVLLILVAVAAIAAEAIKLEGIIGAFLVGLAVNELASGTEAKRQLEFMGDTLFIPMFFISIGPLIDVAIFLRTVVTHFPLMVAVMLSLIGGKLVAALLAQRLYGYSRDETIVMWSLSMPQVAATLAAALVAYQTMDADGRRLIDEPMLSSIIVLMVVTSVLGPIITDRFAPRLVPVTAPPSPEDEERFSSTRIV